MTDTKLSIGFSCYFEHELVINNLIKYSKIIEKHKLKNNVEIIVIEDSGNLEKKIDYHNKMYSICIEKNIDFKIVDNIKNKGFFKSFVSGLINSKYEYFKLFCGDDGLTEDSILQLINNAKNYDLILPYYNQYEIEGKPTWRAFVSNIYNEIVNILSGHKIKYYNGIPLVKKEKALQNLPGTNGFSWMAELITNCLWDGATYKEIKLDQKETKYKYTSLRIKNFIYIFFSLIKIFLRRIKLI